MSNSIHTIWFMNTSTTNGGNIMSFIERLKKLFKSLSKLFSSKKKEDKVVGFSYVGLVRSSIYKTISGNKVHLIYIDTEKNGLLQFVDLSDTIRLANKTKVKVEGSPLTLGEGVSAMKIESVIILADPPVENIEKEIEDKAKEEDKEDHKHEDDDPEFTNPEAEVTSFLWKPESDTDPKDVVVVVSADEIRADDLKIEVYSKDGKKLPLREGRKPFGAKRANKKGNHKYARIMFKLQWKAHDFVKYSPLAVYFYINHNGSKKRVKILGNKGVMVKDPLNRVDF